MANLATSISGGLFKATNDSAQELYTGRFKSMKPH